MGFCGLERALVRLVLPAALVVGAGCGGAAPVVQHPEPADGGVPEQDAGTPASPSPLEDAALRVELPADTERTALVDGLIASLLPSAPGWIVSDFALAEDEIVRLDTGVIAGLDDGRSAELAGSLRVELVSHPALPAELRAALTRAAEASLRGELLCSTAYAPEECSLDVDLLGPAQAELARALARLGEDFSARYAGLAPMPTRDGVPLVGVEVPAFLGLPLHASVLGEGGVGGAGAEIALEPHEGAVALQLAAWPRVDGGLRPIRLEIDAAAFGGAADVLFAGELLPYTELRAREVDTRGFGVSLRELHRGSEVRERSFEATLGGRLGERAGRPPFALEPAGMRALRRGVRERGDGEWDRGLPTHAQAAAGGLDAVVVGEVRTEFAGRAGPTRVWVEARARLEVHDTWTGAILAEVELSARGIGLSELLAEEAALRELAERSAAALAAALAW